MVIYQNYTSAVATEAYVFDQIAGLPPSSGGGLTWVEVEIGLGSVPATGGTVSVSATGLTAGDYAIVMESPTTITSTGETADRLEMDPITMVGYVVGSTELRVYWSSPSPMAGTRKIVYTTFGV